MRRRFAAAAGALILAAFVTGCGDDSATEPSGADEFTRKAIIAVWAPTPLDKPFNEFAADDKLNTQMSFSGANVLARELPNAEVPPDLIVADSESLIDGLAADDLVQGPVPIATDELVLAVPKDSKIESLEDVAAPGVTIAAGAEGVPVGDYAREAIGQLPGTESTAILGNLSPEGANNNGIIETVVKGQADAAFLYATDVASHSDKLRAVELPAGIRPDIVYVGAIVEDAANQPGGRHLLDAMVDGDGVRYLKRHGFGPPPG